MQDWDRLVMVVVGGGAAVYCGVVARRLWKKTERRASAGVIFVGAACVVLPIVLALFGG